MHLSANSQGKCQISILGMSLKMTDLLLHLHGANELTHLPPWTKWPPFYRQYFQMHFHEWKVLYFDLNFTEVFSQVSNWQWPSIGSDNGLAPNRRQAIIWTNAEWIHWHIYAALGGDELKGFHWKYYHLCVWICVYSYITNKKLNFFQLAFLQCDRFLEFHAQHEILSFMCMDMCVFI